MLIWIISSSKRDPRMVSLAFRIASFGQQKTYLIIESTDKIMSNFLSVLWMLVVKHWKGPLRAPRRAGSDPIYERNRLFIALFNETLANVLFLVNSDIWSQMTRSANDVHKWRWENHRQTALRVTTKKVFKLRQTLFISYALFCALNRRTQMKANLDHYFRYSLLSPKMFYSVRYCDIKRTGDISIVPSWIILVRSIL